MAEKNLRALLEAAQIYRTDDEGKEVLRMWAPEETLSAVRKHLKDDSIKVGGISKDGHTGIQASGDITTVCNALGIFDQDVPPKKLSDPTTTTTHAWKEGLKKALVELRIQLNREDAPPIDGGRGTAVLEDGKLIISHSFQYVEKNEIDAINAAQSLLQDIEGRLVRSAVARGKGIQIEEDDLAAGDSVHDGGKIHYHRKAVLEIPLRDLSPFKLREILTSVAEKEVGQFRSGGEKQLEEARQNLEEAQRRYDSAQESAQVAPFVEFAANALRTIISHLNDGGAVSIKAIKGAYLAFDVATTPAKRSGIEEYLKASDIEVSAHAGALVVIPYKERAESKEVPSGATMMGRKFSGSLDDWKLLATKIKGVAERLKLDVGDVPKASWVAKTEPIEQGPVWASRERK